jgi:hypothetical protein
LLEEMYRGDIAQIMSDLKVSMSAGTLSVDDTLRNTLAIEVSEEVDVVEILEKKRSVGPSSLSRVGFRDGCSVGSGVDSAVLVVEHSLSRHGCR